MPLRALFKYLADNERLVQRIAESYPMRRAAQLAISFFYKGQEKLSKVDPENMNRLRSLLRRFSENLHKGIEDAKKQLKK